jgi:hypothetical protein
MASRDLSGLIQALFLFGGGIAGAAFTLWLDPEPWLVTPIIVAGVIGGIAAHLWWERRPGGRKVRPERLKDLATAIQTFHAGTGHYGDQRRWAAVSAMRRLAAQGADPADREQISAFARAGLEKEVRKQSSPGRFNSIAWELVNILAITNPAWQEHYLESLLGTPGDKLIRERLADMRRTPLSEADRQYVRDALARFEEVGLKIKTRLDRELIVARALLDADRWRYDDFPDERGKKFAPDPLAALFAALAGETDALHGCGDAGPYGAEPELLRSMRELALKSPGFSEDYSFSIFENAAEIWPINEGDGIACAAEALAALSGGAISTASNSNPGRGVIAIVSNGAVFTCSIGGGKHPDLEPFYDILNQAASGLGHQYECNLGTNCDASIFAYIPLGKLAAFIEFAKPLDA